MVTAVGLQAPLYKDAILLGPAGDLHIPDPITLWGFRLKICQGCVRYANVRPRRIVPGIDAPLKRCLPHQGHPIEVATDVSMMTRVGVERIIRYAFKLAQSRLFVAPHLTSWARAWPTRLVLFGVA